MQPIHVALLAPSKEAVHQFHSAALKAGAKDNGPPGFRASTATITTPRSCSTSMVTKSKRVTSAKRRRLNEPGRERLLNVAG